MGNDKVNHILQYIADKAHYVIILIFVVILIRSCVNDIIDWDRLMRTRIITTGTIAGVRKAPRSAGTDIYYWFEVEGEVFNCRTGRRIRVSEADTLIGMHFPVAYEKGNPSNNEIIVTPKEFEEFKIPFPDSLRWIRRIQFY